MRARERATQVFHFLRRVFSFSHAARFLRTRLAAKHSYDAAGAKHDWPSLDGAARALVDDAVHNKSATDNVSVVALRFAPLDKN